MIAGINFRKFDEVVLAESILGVASCLCRGVCTFVVCNNSCSSAKTVSALHNYFIEIEFQELYINSKCEY